MAVHLIIYQNGRRQYRRTNIRLVQHSARNTCFLNILAKVIPKQSTDDDSNPGGVCVKCFDYMLLWAGLQSIEKR